MPLSLQRINGILPPCLCCVLELGLCSSSDNPSAVSLVLLSIPPSLRKGELWSHPSSSLRVKKKGVSFF
ncbi:hypothetical protein J4Q44_G00265110 [Coregonus suidteri]|uniref:Uncharacterized protein n=1 Tax=Coregonus suidteri TaxID=861788 RepID=A0AAN8QWI9_9TELE